MFNKLNKNLKIQFTQHGPLQLKAFVFILILLSCNFGFSQFNLNRLEFHKNNSSYFDKELIGDTVKQTTPKRNTRAVKATIFSACLPGLGQAYNKKYWKIPIIYAGLGGFGYLFVKNNVKYIKYRNDLKYENDDDASTLNSSPYNTQQLIILKHRYRRYRDLSIIGGSIVYILNILDANVDAHLYNFDVSDNLSLNIKPYADYQTSFSTGLQLNLNFHTPKKKSVFGF